MSNKYYPEHATDFIKDYLYAATSNYWGLRIYRTTYNDDKRFQKFIELLKADSEEVLTESDDSDLVEYLKWEIVDDEQNLENKTWEETRTFHDNWVLTELENEAAEGKDQTIRHPGLSEQEILGWRTQTTPRWEFFIFADEESVNSVVDADASNTRGRPGTFFVTIVQSNLVDKSEMNFGEGDESEIPRKAYWQRFKGWEIVEAYAGLLSGRWPHNFQVEKDGLSSVRTYQ